MSAVEERLVSSMTMTRKQQVLSALSASRPTARSASMHPCLFGIGAWTKNPEGYVLSDTEPPGG